MELTMRDWKVEVPRGGELLGYEGDHLSRTLTIRTDAPEEYQFRLDMARGGKVNVVELAREGETLSVELTASMLARDGNYACQLRGTAGEKVRHSNIFFLRVDDSLNGEEAFPEGLPSEFIQMEERIMEAVERAVKAAVRAEAAAMQPAKVAPATRERLGGVLVGDGLNVAEDGTLSANEMTAQDVEQMFQEPTPETAGE